VGRCDTDWWVCFSARGRPDKFKFWGAFLPGDRVIERRPGLDREPGKTESHASLTRIWTSLTRSFSFRFFAFMLLCSFKGIEVQGSGADGGRRLRWSCGAHVF
jgi:hypothetical protein